VQGGSPRALGSLEGRPWVCGADMGFDAGDAAYLNEIGFIGFGPLTFEWTQVGYLHTMGCNGLGLALSNGSTDLWNNPSLQNAVLSPDKTQVLAVQITPGDPVNSPRKLVIVDLASGNLTNVDTQPNIDRAIWSRDGKTIIYSTLAPVRKVTGDKSKAAGAQIFADHWPLVDVPEYGIIVYTMPIGGGTSTQIFKEVGRGVGFITAAHHRAAVLFSFITSFAKMIDSINAGDPSSKSLSLAPHAELRLQPLDANGFPVKVTDGGQPAYSPADSFAITPAQLKPGANNVPTLVVPTLVNNPPPTLVQPPQNTVAPTSTASIVLGSGGNCPGVVPSRLHVGGQGQVLPGQSNRFRTAPNGDIIGMIPANGVFDVLGGPVCTSNSITWWKVRFNGSDGYTAEAQASTYFVQPFTGAPPPTAPAPGSFGIVGVTAAVSPGSAAACPTMFNFSGQIVVNTSGTVMYRWERSDGAAGPTVSITYAPGVTTIDVHDTWTLSGNTSGWERIHVLSPNDISSNQANFTLTCGAAVTHVTASVSSPGGASCPILYNFAGTITTNAAATVTYKWERSDGASAPVQTLSFGGAGSQAVTTSWKLGGSSGSTYNGWERIHVLTPNDVVSNQANFVLTCP